MNNKDFPYLVTQWNSWTNAVDDLMPVLVDYYGSACTREWAEYKYCDIGNPTFAALAIFENQIVGITVAGIQKFNDQGQHIFGTFSLVNYVHPDHRGRGLYTALLKDLEAQAIASEVSFMITMPNVSSSKGFAKAGYETIGTSRETIIASSFGLPVRALRSGPNLGHFRPMEPISSVKDSIPERLSDAHSNDETIRSVLTVPFLHHRLSPMREHRYTVEELRDGTDAVLMHGRRGKLRECRILATSLRTPESIHQSGLYPYIRKTYSPDIITIRSTTTTAPKLQLQGTAITRRANPPLLVRTTQIASKGFNPLNIRLTGIDTHTW